jgi:GcrA cell cycle regulator
MGALWTEEREAALRKWHGLGLSGSAIAVQLGISRNAVLGKIDRLGLSSGEPRSAKPVRQKPKVERKRPWMPLPETVELPAMPAAPKNAITLLELKSHQCRWPFGDGPILFCGGDAVDGKPYCAGHCRVAYRI